MTKNRSSIDKLLDVISGSWITPTAAAMLSPKLRDMARPGPLPSDYQTLAGPAGARPFSIIGRTIPPWLMILFCSSGRSGFWSMEIASAYHFPDINLPITARESPTFATVSSLSRITVVQHVLPL